MVNVYGTHHRKLIPEETPIHKNLVDRTLFCQIETALGGKYWVPKLLIFSLLSVLFFALPSYERFWNPNNDYKSIWTAIANQIEHPLKAGHYDPRSHEAKIAFRLFPALIGQLAPFSEPLSRVMFIFFVQHLCGVFFFLMLIKWAYATVADKVSVFLVVYSFVFVYIGRCFFYEFYPFFDGIAFFIMMMALCLKNPWAAFAVLSFAYWTDERAVIASPLILLYHLLDRGGWQTLTPKQMLANYRTYIPYFATLGLYAVMRLVLQAEYDLHTPVGGRADAGFSVFLDQLSHIPLAVVLAYEGSWLLIGAAAYVFLTNRSYSLLASYLGILVIILVVSCCVWDVSRSVSYSFPALLIAFGLLANRYPIRYTRYVMLGILCFNLLIPTYKYHFHNFFWQVPAPLKLVHYFLG